MAPSVIKLLTTICSTDCCYCCCHWSTSSSTVSFLQYQKSIHIHVCITPSASHISKTTPFSSTYTVYLKDQLCHGFLHCTQRAMHLRTTSCHWTFLTVNQHAGSPNCWHSMGNDARLRGHSTGMTPDFSKTIYQRRRTVNIQLLRTWIVNFIHQCASHISKTNVVMCLFLRYVAFCLQQTSPKPYTSHKPRTANNPLSCLRYSSLFN